jgi:hypothetical protein
MSDFSELKRLAEAHAQKDAVDPIESKRVMLVEPTTVLSLIAENERLVGCEDVLRQLASYVGAGGYNASEVDPEVFARKILDGINILNDPLAQLILKKDEQIDQLKAENAGLKTGYEGYEQVVQGLRGEVEALLVLLREMRSIGNYAPAELILRVDAAIGKGDQS